MLHGGEEEGAGLTVCLSLLLSPGSGAVGSLAAAEVPTPAFHSLLATLLVTESSPALTSNDWSQDFSRLF